MKKAQLNLGAEMKCRMDPDLHCGLKFKIRHGRHCDANRPMGYTLAMKRTAMRIAKSGY